MDPNMNSGQKPKPDLSVVFVPPGPSSQPPTELKTVGVTPNPPGSVGTQPVTGSVQKEQLPPSLRSAETVIFEEMNKDQELEPEVEGWIEHLKHEGEIKLPEPIKDDKGEVVMAEAPAQIVDDKLVVPMTQTGLSQAIKQPVSSSARWLAEWIKRLIKMFGGRVVYKSN